MIKIRSLENKKTYIILSQNEYCYIFSNPQTSLNFKKKIRNKFKREIYLKFYKIIFKLILIIKTPILSLLKKYFRYKFINILNNNSNNVYAVHWNSTLRKKSEGLSYFHHHFCSASSDPFNILPFFKKINLTSRDFVKVNNTINNLEKTFDFTFVGNPTFNKNVFNFLEAAKKIYLSDFDCLKTCTIFPCSFNQIFVPPFIDTRLLVNEIEHLNQFPFNNRIFLNRKMSYPGMSRELIFLIMKSSKYLVLFSDEEGEPRIVTEAHTLGIPTVINKEMLGSVHDSCLKNKDTIYSKNAETKNIYTALKKALELNLKFDYDSQRIYQKNIHNLTNHIIKALSLFDKEIESRKKSLSEILSKFELIHVLAGHALHEKKLKNKLFSIEIVDCKNIFELFQNIE